MYSELTFRFPSHQDLPLYTGAHSGSRLVAAPFFSAMVIKTDNCSYTEYRIYPGHGQKFVAKDAKAERHSWGVEENWAQVAPKTPSRFQSCWLVFELVDNPIFGTFEVPNESWKLLGSSGSGELLHQCQGGLLVPSAHQAGEAPLDAGAKLWLKNVLVCIMFLVN